MKARYLLIVVVIALVFGACQDPLAPAEPGDAGGGGGGGGGTPSGPVDAVDYLKMDAGVSQTYEITYPASYPDPGDPTEIAVTFQEFGSSADAKVFFVTSAGRRHSFDRVEIDADEVRYAGGNHSVLDSTLYQKVILPVSLPTDAPLDLVVDSDWYGPGTYTIEHHDSLTVGGNDYADCIRVDFPSSKLNFTDQQGHGFYVLTRANGLVYYEATFDDSGSLGDAGDTIFYRQTSSTTLAARSLTATITDHGASVSAQAYMDLTWGYGPTITSDASGAIAETIYLPDGHGIGRVNVYLSMDGSRGEYVQQFYPGTPGSGEIALGTLDYDFTLSTVGVASLSPADAATGVDPTTTLLTVTFDGAMNTGGSMSLVYSSAGTFPPMPGDPVWTDEYTLEIPVSLDPDTTYALSLNSPVYLNFEDTNGDPIAPFEWTFTTGS